MTAISLLVKILYDFKTYKTCVGGREFVPVVDSRHISRAFAEQF